MRSPFLGNAWFCSLKNAVFTINTEMRVHCCKVTYTHIGSSGN